MALTGKFIADFDSFYDAVQKADAKLMAFASDTSKVGPALNRMVDSFSGKKIIEDATLMTRAIGGVEGIAKLTGTELERLSGTVNAAMEKMTLMGEKVPPEFQKIAEATKNISTAAKPAAEHVSTLGDQFKTIAGAVGLGLGIGQVVSQVIGFGRAILADVDALQRMHDQTGVSLQGLQKFQIAADDAGNSVDDITGAITKMEDKLASQDPKALQALADLKIPFEDIKNLHPENQFIAISDAIRQVHDPAERVRLAIDLFGKAGASVLPTLVRGFDDLKGAVVGMSDETIKSIDLVSDTMGAWYRATKGHAANIIVEFARVVQAGINPTRYAAQSLARDMEDIRDAAAKIPPAAKAMAPPLAVPKAEDASVKRADAEAEDRLRKAQEDRKKALDALKKAQDDYAESLRKLQAHMYGADAIDKASLALQALGRDFGRLSVMTQSVRDELHKTMDDAIAAFRAMGQEAPEAMYAVWTATLPALSEIKDFSKALDYLAKEQMPLFARTTVDAMGQAIPKVEGLKQAGLGLKDSLTKTLADIPNTLIAAFTGGGSLTGAVEAIAVQLGADFGNALAKSIKDNTKNKVSTLNAKNVGLAGAAGAMTGIGAAASGASTAKAIGAVGMTALGITASAAISAGALTASSIALGAATMGIGTAAIFAYIGLKKLFGTSEADKVRMTRDAFIETAGGIGTLNQKAYEAGTTLDNLLNARKVKDYDAALEQLNASFEYQKDAFAVLTETAQRYGFTLEELGPALQRQGLEAKAQQLFKDFEVLNAAGIDSVAILTRMGGAASEYLNEALKFGVEIPAAMQPMLEDMAKAGTLTDENGNKITDLTEAGVKFALTMSEGFKQLIASVDKLAMVLSRSLGVAIDDTSNRINAIPRNVVVDVDFRASRAVPIPPVGPATDQLESFQQGTDGYRNFGTGTPVMLHGWEAVVPREETSTPGGDVPSLLAPGGAAGGSPVTIVINAQGAFFDTPGSEQRLADIVNRALTSKMGLSTRQRAA